MGVEDSEVSTMRRSEGLYFAANGFSKKIISGLGVVFAGNIVTLTGLDEVRSAEDMSWQKRFHLARVYLPIMAGLQLIALGCLSRYSITRTKHDANLQKLAERRDSTARLLRSADGQPLGR